MRSCTVSLVLAIAGTAHAQPFEHVVSEYALDGTHLITFAGAGADSGIQNSAVEVGPDGNVYVTRSALSSSNDFTGSVNSFTRAGSPVESWFFDAENQSKRKLNDLAVAPNADIYVAAENGLGPIGQPETRGSIFRIDHNNDAISVLQPFDGAPDYRGVTTAPGNRIFASAWRGNFMGDDQMVRTNIIGSQLDSFSPTGNSVFHTELAYDSSFGLIAMVGPNGDQSDNHGWRIFGDDGSLTGVVNLGGSDQFDPVGLSFVGGSLWTYNRATSSVERYTVGGGLLESFSIPEVTDFLSDFTLTPEGTALFTHRITVPAPASAAVLGLALTLVRRRR
jgi:hypothetical protein